MGSREKFPVTAEYQVELDNRLPAFVKCDGEEAAVRELETLQARYRELAKDAREAVWRGDAPTAAPAHDPELVVSRDVLKKAREARQASVAAALRVQSLPPISDVVATQIRDSVPGLSDDQLLHTLRSHFRGTQRSVALSHAQHLRRFLRPGGGGLDSPHALAQMRRLQLAAADTAQRLVRLGSMEASAHTNTMEGRVEESGARAMWQVQPSDVNAYARHLTFQYACAGVIRQFFYRVVWMPFSHREALLERTLEVMALSAAVSPVHDRMHLSEHTAGRHALATAPHAAPSQLPQLTAERAALEAALDELKAFFGVKEEERGNRLVAKVSALLPSVFRRQAALRRLRPDGGCGDINNGGGELSEEAEPVMVLETEELDPSEEARYGGLVAEAVGGGAVLPCTHVHHALDAENGFMDVDELSEVKARLAKLAATHYSRVSQTASLPPKERFLNPTMSSVLAGTNPATQPSARIATPSPAAEFSGTSSGELSQGLSGETSRESAAEGTSAGGSPWKTMGAGDATEAEAGALLEEESSVDQPPLSEQSLEALYTLRLLRTRTFKLRLLHALNAVEAVKRRLVREAAAEEAAELEAAAAGDAPTPPCLSASEADPLSADILEEDAEVGLRVYRPQAPGAVRREYIVYASALREFTSTQQRLLQVGSHFIEVTRKLVKDDPAVMGAIDPLRMLEHLYELHSRFESAKLALMHAYLDVYDEATDPVERARLREGMLRTAARRPELHPDDAYFAGGYTVGLLSLELELQALREMTTKQRAVEASARAQIYGPRSELMAAAAATVGADGSEASREAAQAAGVEAPPSLRRVDVDAPLPGLPLPLLSPVPSGEDTGGGGAGGEGVGVDATERSAVDLFPTCGALSLLPMTLQQAVAALCEAHDLTSARETAAMRQAVLEQVLVEWQLTVAEEQQYGRMEMSSLERACGETAPLHIHQLMQFADNAAAVDVLFAEAATAEKAAALGYGPNAQRQAVRAAAAVLQLVTSRIALADALRETRTLAAVYVTQAMALGVNIQYSAELDPIDFTGVGVRAGTQLADVERAMLPKVTVPLIATQRLCLAAAQFDEAFAQVDLGTLEGVRRTVSPAGLVRTQRLLRAQWTEAALMATATRHNSLLLDSARRVRLRRRAALCLGVQRKLGARFTNEAKMAAQRAGTAVATGNASKSSAGKPVVTAGDDSNFFLTAMRHSITFSPDDDPYAIPTPTPLTTLLIQVKLSDSQTAELHELYAEMVRLLAPRAMSIASLKLQLRRRYADEFAERAARQVTGRGGSHEAAALTATIKEELLEEYSDELLAVTMPWAQRCQLAEAALDVRRAVAAIHMPPPAGVGERRVGPFDETLLDLAHAECLQELTADDDGRRALGVRGKWFATDGSVNRKTAFSACLVDEYGKLNSVFNLPGPLEVLALPLDNHMLRTLHTLCTTLGQVVELRAAIASMTVPVDELQGHVAPGAPVVMTELSTLAAQLSNLKSDTDADAATLHLDSARDLLLLRYLLALRRTATQLALRDKPRAYAVVKRLELALHTRLMPLEATPGITPPKTAPWAAFPSPASPCTVGLASLSLAMCPDSPGATGQLPDRSTLQLHSLDAADRALLANADAELGLLLDGKLQADDLYNMMQPERAVTQQTYVCRVLLVESALRSHLAAAAVPELTALLHPMGPCPRAEALASGDAALAVTLEPKVAAAMTSATQMSAEELADPSLLRRRPLLLSNVGATDAATAALQRCEAFIFCGKKEADAAALQAVLVRLRRECRLLSRDVAVVYPTLAPASASDDATAAFVSRLHSLGTGHVSGKDGDTTYMIGEKMLKQWTAELVSRTYTALERRTAAADAAAAATTAALRRQVSGAAAEAARLTHQAELDKASLRYQVQSQLCDHGLALFHKVEELQRVIDFQQYQLMHQEKRLRAQIYVDFEAQLKEMADKVDVAHTMEQGRDLAIRERLLTDMAALRKDTMLKLQLQTWMVDQTSDKQRADMLEIELDHARAREAELERALLAKHTLGRMRQRVADMHMDRRMRAFVASREATDTLAWGELRDAQAGTSVAQEQLQKTAAALRNTQAALRAANDEVANQRRQKAQLLKYKVEVQKQAADDAANASRPTSALSGTSRPLSPTRSARTASPMPRASSHASGGGHADDAESGGGGSGRVSVASSRDGGPPSSARSAATRSERTSARGGDDSQLLADGAVEGATAHTESVGQHTLAHDDSEELMERLQADGWRRKYEGELDRLQQLERDNERMRDALLRVETLVPGMLENDGLLPDQLREEIAEASSASQSRPSSGVPSRLSSMANSRPTSSTTAFGRGGVSSATPRPPSAVSRLVQQMRPPSAPTERRRPMSGVPASRTSPQTAIAAPYPSLGVGNAMENVHAGGKGGKGSLFRPTSAPMVKSKSTVTGRATPSSRRAPVV